MRVDVIRNGRLFLLTGHEAAALSDASCCETEVDLNLGDHFGWLSVEEIGRVFPLTHGGKGGLAEGGCRRVDDADLSDEAVFADDYAKIYRSTLVSRLCIFGVHGIR